MNLEAMKVLVMAILALDEALRGFPYAAFEQEVKRIKELHPEEGRLLGWVEDMVGVAKRASEEFDLIRAREQAAGDPPREVAWS
jgi:hypothetical protein